MITTLAQYADKGIWLPDQASTFAQDMDWLFLFITWVSVVFTVLIMGALVWFVLAHRMKPGDEGKVSHGSHHNNALEVTWSVIPLLIVLAIFVWGFRGFLDMQTPPGDSYEVYVVAKKWSWSFQYPEGKTSDVLVVPANQPVKLTLESQDVLHSFFVPAFRTKKDAVPGRYNTVWFEAQWDDAKARGEFTSLSGEKFENVIAYDLYCTEYCGTNHSWMRTSAVVMQPADFDAWINVRVEDDPTLTPIQKGERLYLQNGCNACHTADGSASTGPTFRNLFGKQEQTDKGSVTVDEAYITESIRQPGAKIVNGYSNQMMPFNLTDRQIGFIAAWMKSVSDGHGTPDEINAQHGGPAGPSGQAAESQSGEAQVVPTQEDATQTPSQQQEEQTGRSEQGVEVQ